MKVRRRERRENQRRKCGNPRGKYGSDNKGNPEKCRTRVRIRNERTQAIREKKTETDKQ